MIEFYTANWCPSCIKLKSLLKENQIKHTLIDIDKDPEISRAKDIRAIPVMIKLNGDRLIGSVTQKQLLSFIG